MSLENFTARCSRHAWHRLCLWSAVLAAVLVLGGCGPGVVGTGDGGLAPDDTAIQFTPANVCDAGFAATGLDCTANDEKAPKTPAHNGCAAAHRNKHHRPSLSPGRSRLVASLAPAAACP